MRKTSISSNSFGGFLSPGAPSYSDNKGWSSERVPHPSSSTSTAAINGRRQHIGSASALTTPFYSGRAIPSKWEDAERWICSPIATYPPGVCKNPSVSSQFSEQRRQKSKSGPIVPPPTLPHPPTSSSSAIGCYHNYSPRMMMRSLDAPPKGLMVVGSPFSTGVLEADRVFRGSVGGGCDSYGHGHGHRHGHSRSWVDLMSEETSSLSSKTDTEEKAEDTKEGEMTTAVQSPVVSRRDMATQMSPEEASPKNSPPLVVSVIEPPCRGEVREVKMDKGARMIKRPKRRVMSSRVVRRQQPEVEDNSEASASSSSWDISEPAMNLSKLQREEAKIAAWENLQKAKAEAAIRKLEVKLEKKKSASMDKILNKLQTAKMKAQEMRRSSVSSEHEQQQGNHQISRNSVKITHLVRRHTFMTPFMTCFAPRVDCRKSSSAL
ncbi:Remorin 4.1 [Cardamine amara subsp. amara]|uniref:Remorin 4.1 n=1 Tax=Cardamine amara subsp. amara TaxID=228776 RepID=A0ABD1A0D7_CARAN